MVNKKLFFADFILGLIIVLTASVSEADVGSAIDFSGLKSPIVLRGDLKRAFRDPVALYHNGKLYLFYTLVRTEADGLIYSYTAVSKSGDLEDWDWPGEYAVQEGASAGAKN